MKVQLTILLLMLLMVTSCVQAQDSDIYQIETQCDAEFELPLYNPAKVVVQFAYTHNSSVSNVKTLGYSLWTETRSPIGIEFNAKEVDTFEFDIILLYAQVTEQVVQVAVWSGTLPPAKIPIRVNSDKVRLHFKLVVTEQPRPPTSEEVASATLLMTRQELQYYMDQITILTRQFNESLSVMWILVAANTMFGIIALITSMYMLRSRRA